MASLWWLGPASSLLTLFLLLLGSTLSLDTSGQGLSIVTIEQNPAILFETQNVTLSCNGVGGSDANYTWFMGDWVELTGSKDNVMLLGNQLIISELSVAEWDGVCITCQAVTMTTMDSDSLNLTVATRLPTFTVHPANLTVTLGMNFTLNCSAIGLPDPTIQLFKNRISVSLFLIEKISNGVYRFTNADDSFTPGQYVCRASNTIGTVDSYTATITVNFAPTLDTQPEDVDALYGTSALLNCSARGSPEPNITWTKDSEALDFDDGRIQILENGSLLFQPVNISDVGVYHCNATNELGFDDSDAANLIVNVFPMFVTTPSTMVHIHLEESTTLECDAFAFPPANYFWSRVNCDTEERIEAVTTGNGLRVSGGNLTVETAMRMHRGCYQCRAVNELGDIDFVTRLKVSAPPLPPEQVTVDQVGSFWINVVWTEVDNYPAIQNYRLEYKLQFLDNWTPINDISPNDESYNITMLYPNATYDVRVSALSPLGPGNSSLVVMATTMQGVPLDVLGNGPEEVSSVSTSPNSITVSWRVPEVLLMTSYLRASVELTGPDGQMVMEEGLTEATFTGLTPAVDYSITVTFIFAGEFLGPASSPSHIARTLDGVPGDAPNITSVSTTSSSAVVTWAPPTIPNGIITYYTITTLPTTSSQPILVNGTVLAYEIVDLTPFTNYTIFLSANTSAGEGPMDMVLVQTQEDVPPPPTNVTVIALNSTSIVVSWQPLSSEDVPGILVNYEVKYNQLHHGHSPSFEQVSPMDSETVLGNLKPYTTYRVSVAAVTRAGNGSFSGHIDGRTFGAVPGVTVMLVGVTAMCPPGLLVEWAELNTKEFYGPLEEIYLIVNYTNEASGMSTSSRVKYDGNTIYVLEDLDVFTNYSIHVAVANINGTGLYSEPTTNVSCDGVAVAPNITGLTAINSTAILVSWQLLDSEDVPGVIVYYVIKYVDGAEPIKVPADRSTYMYVISGLSPYTNYTVSIASETRYGTEGLFGDTYLIRTLGDVPVDQLTILSVFPSCPLFGVEVQWSKLDSSSYQGPIDEVFYMFSYTNNSDGVTVNLSVSALNVAMVNDTTLSYIIQDVAVNSSYSVSVALSNINGTGPLSQSVMGPSPEEGVPSAPLNVTVSTINATSLRVAWQPPTTPNGRPTYVVYYTPIGGFDPSLTRTPLLLTDVREASIPNLYPYNNYSIEVAAQTSCNKTRSEAVIGLTAESRPGPPADVVTVPLPRAVTVKWEMPDEPNGTILYYNVFCPGVANATVQSSPPHVHDCSNLEPVTMYNISLSAVNGADESINTTVSVTTACEGSPPELDMIRDTFVIKSVDKQNCTVRALYVLVVVQAVDIGSEPPKNLSDYSLQELKESTTAYSRARGRRQAMSRGGVYIAANISESELDGEGFTLGDGTEDKGYTNHALEPGLAYTVGLRSKVNGTNIPITVNSVSPQPITIGPIPTATPASTEPTSIPLIPVVASAGAAGLVVLAICFVAIISCCCRCCSRSLDKLETGGGSGRLERGGSFRLSRRKLIDPIESFRNNHRTEALEEHPAIPVMGFLNKLSIMQTNDNQLFLEEFGSIDMAPQFSTDVANLPLNRAKNRYNNILPYDHSRVKLSSHKHSTDYINANYCAGYMKQKTYIATQGPIPESISDFWRMVWEQDSRTIIMLTNPFEKGKLKCEVYWPREIGASAMHGNIEVTMTDMTQLADYTIRNFTIHKGGTSKEPRELRHFHFTSWPDHGVPQYATAMLSMLRRVKAWQPPSDVGPVIVHCSAGVGRSGTYIVIDTMLERLKNGDDNLDIYGHVSLLRTQRPYMVQTEDQYFFIHEAVAEALMCGVTEVKVEKLHSYIQELCSLIPEDEAGHTHMELQFKRLALDRNDPNRFQTATKDANKSKNRYVNVLPYENNRVCLEYMRGVDGSDYVNASHIDSYHARRAFIATQGPLPNTVLDFWRMVWQYNAPVIVMLTECMEKGTERSSCYWPTEVRTGETYDKFLIEMAVERNSTHYSYRDLYITNTECHQRRLVRQFHFHSWPEAGVPSNPMVLVEFIREVQKLYSSLNTKSPLVIHCSNGVGRTGVFIALHIILERLVVEGMADIFQTVKNLRIQRPAMVQSLDQYHFCYDATVDYIESTDMAFNLRQRSQSVLTAGSTESKRKSRPSNETTPSRSPARNQSQARHTGSLTRNTPARTESFKGSARNLELNQLGNGGSQIYGGSEGTSTFGNHRSSMNASPPPITSGSLSSSQVQLNSVQQNGNHGLSQQGLSQPLSGSQPQLHLGLGGGSQPQLNLTGGTTSSQQSGYSGLSDGILTFQGTHVQVGSAPAHQLAETQRYSTASTNRSSYTGET